MRLSTPLSAVHPRASGEHISWPIRCSRASGSSQRERGTPVSQLPFRARRRFIPARAGNTTAPPNTPCPRTVHPRASGEHTEQGFRVRGGAGSSPRERGTLASRHRRHQAHRFIPARAGNTRWPCSVMNSVVGSSPRERGTLTGPVGIAVTARFIPARAGNTQAQCPVACRAAVHPRASGEHGADGGDGHRGGGSSPRERGTPCRLERPC